MTGDRKNMDHLRGEIGEMIVAYELMKRQWDVMRHLGGHGYDLTATKGTVERHIEVKTTDPSLRTGNRKGQLTVKLSDSERSMSSHLVFYVHGLNTFFVIPRSAFPDSGSVTVNVGRDGRIASGTAYEPYRDRWEVLE